jgi:hypothetical protein
LGRRWEPSSLSYQDIAANIAQASLGIQEVNSNAAQCSQVTESITSDIAEVNQLSSEMAYSSSKVNMSSEELAGLAEKITDVFRSRLPHQFVVCMWTSRRRKKLMQQAKKYDAVVVLGCEAAVQTSLDLCDAASFKVVQGMRNEGIISILPRFQLPSSITPLLHRNQGTETWMRL